MYVLSRLLLMIAVGSTATCLLVLTIVTWPTSGLFVALILAVHIMRRGPKRYTTLGSARWASEDELRSAQLIGGDDGLHLGRLSAAPMPLAQRVRRLYDRRVDAREACRQLLVSNRRRRAEFVRLPKAIHTAVFSPSGGGKGVSCVLPFLLSERGSCVVVDFKGENALLTARHRQKRFGHRIALLDPFQVVTKTPDRFNPLDFIEKNSPHAIDHCNDLAKALVIRNPEEKEPHWSDSAEAFIAAMLATVVQYGDRQDSRSLQTVRDFLSHPQKLDLAIKLMCESDCWGGMLARVGGQLTYFEGKERASVLTSVGRHLRFLDTLAVAESTKSSSFDPAALRSGKMTAYLVMPPDFMRSQSALLRLWIGALLRAVIAGGLQEQHKVHFILDEAASLGHLEAIDDAVDKYRGYGVRLQFYYQSLGQLRKCFPDGQDQTLLSNATQVYFGVNDNATADYVSTRLGEGTIVVESGGSSSGYSSQWSESTQPSNGGGSSDNTSYNWQQQARRLLKPEEVMTLPPRTAITFTPGVAPICTTLVRHYEERRNVWRRRGPFYRAAEACCTLVVSLVLAVGSTRLAFESIEYLNQHIARSQRAGAQQRIETKGARKHRPAVPVRRR